MMEVSWDTLYLMAWNGEDYDSEVLALLEDADRLSRRYENDRFPPIIRFFFSEGKISLKEDWS